MEAYVRRRLNAADTDAFEEHYFQCGQCFEDVQAMEKFIAGIGHASRKGLLNQTYSLRSSWLAPAFAFAAAAAVILASGLAFLALIKVPEKEARLQAALTQLKESQSRIAELDQRAALESAPQGNVPVVILEASRGVESNRLQVEAGTQSALLWIDIPQQSADARFALTISTPDDRYSKAIHGLARNHNGALAVSLPVEELHAGSYIVRLYPDKPAAPVMAEYRFTVARR